MRKAFTVIKNKNHPEFISGFTTSQVVAIKETAGKRETLSKDSSGWTWFNNGKSAFTLIELLVVVLIIGILAAIALPQYQKTIVKARASTILPVLDSIAQAQEIYYMANGYYTKDPSELDVMLPAECRPIREGVTTNWICGNGFHVVTNTYGGIVASYCPGYNEDVLSCIANRSFFLRYGFEHCTEGKEGNCEKSEKGYLPKERVCKVTNESSLGKAVCSSIGLEKI